MKSHTKLKLRFRRLILFGSALAALGFAQARAEETTVEIVHYFNVQGQIDALEQLQKDFEAANPDIKLHFTYVPFGELVSRTLQMAAVHKPPAISAIDNPDVLRVAKAGILKDISADVAKIELWSDVYPGPKAAVTDGSKVYGVPIGSNSLALYYNKKMLTDGGVSAPPQTWDQLTETASKTTKSPVYGIAFSAVNTEEATWQWEPFLWSNGGSLSDLASPNAAGCAGSLGGLGQERFGLQRRSQLEPRRRSERVYQRARRHHGDGPLAARKRQEKRHRFRHRDNSRPERGFEAGCPARR